MQLLETDRLLLRPFTLDDAEGLYAYASHPEVGPPAGWPPHRSVEESRQVIENIFIPSDALAVLRKSDGRLIGSAGFVDRHRAELGSQRGDRLFPGPGLLGPGADPRGGEGDYPPRLRRPGLPGPVGGLLRRQPQVQAGHAEVRHDLPPLPY